MQTFGHHRMCWDERGVEMDVLVHAIQYTSPTLPVYNMYDIQPLNLWILG